MKKTIAALCTILILTIIYARIDWSHFWRVCQGADLRYLSVAATFFFITTFISILRWQLLLKGEVILPLGKATKIFLAAMSLNSIMPSKLGDLSKALFLKQESIVGIKRGFDTVFLEKLLDLASLCMLFVFGAFSLSKINQKVVYALIFFSIAVVIFTVLFITMDQKSNPLNLLVFKFLRPFPRLKTLIEDTQKYLSQLKKNHLRLFIIISMSILLWALHLIQIYYFFLTLRAPVTIMEVFGLVPTAILIGLMPLTIGGMGTRDAVLIYLFSANYGYETMAGIGLLVSTRYWVPSLVGLPFLRRYLSGSTRNVAVDKPMKG